MFSELQCTDACVRGHSCIAYNMEVTGSSFRCTTLTMIEKIERKAGSAYRIFDRESIEKVCRFILKLKILPKKILPHVKFFYISSGISWENLILICRDNFPFVINLCILVTCN